MNEMRSKQGHEQVFKVMEAEAELHAKFGLNPGPNG